MGALKVLIFNRNCSRKAGHVEESFESSKDNRKIQGWIVHPPDFDPPKSILWS